jgi:hypothetical protein
MATATNSMLASNLDPATTTTFAANVGDVIKLCRPAGYPPWPIDNPPSEIAGIDASKERLGFKLLDPVCGKFIRDYSARDTCVYYSHEKSGRQVISYYAGGSIVPVTFYAVVQGILVHDHASVYMGGPAYATYYAETPQEE